MDDGPGPEREEILIGGLCGSLRGGSYTRMALAVALRGAADAGASTRLIDLRDFDLIFCNGDKHPKNAPGVDSLRSVVKACDGLIIGTPEYHGSFSGVIKNALDLLGFDEMRGKMIGLVGVSGGAMGGLNALNGLRTIGRSLHAWVVPAQATVPRAREIFEVDGTLNDPALTKRLLHVGSQVARFTYLHHSQQAREFLSLWEAAPPNPGA